MQVNVASKQLEHTLNDFEELFLNSRKFMLGDNISYADLSAICEIDQPSKYCLYKFCLPQIILAFTHSILFLLLLVECIGFNAFKNRNKLARWYDMVREELGPYYKNVHKEFESKLKLNNGQQQLGEAHALKQ